MLHTLIAFSVLQVVYYLFGFIKTIKDENIWNKYESRLILYKHEAINPATVDIWIMYY